MVFKLSYHGVDRKRNGVGVILKESYVKNAVEVKSAGQGHECEAGN